MSPYLHPLKITEVRPEIGGAATSVIFEVPPDLSEVFQWQGGQHITLRFVIGGEELRRSYTISQPPGSPLRITVKRVRDGRISNHIGDALRSGDFVDVMAPFGRFALKPDRTARRTHYFFGAGSGITPLRAMIGAVLEHEPHSKAYLILGNRDADSILLGEELEALQSSHAERFLARHVFSAPSFWRSAPHWRRGRLDAKAVKAAIAETPPVAQDVQYWICGPDSFNDDLKSALVGLDVPLERIHMESFGDKGAKPAQVKSVAATVRITLDGSTQDVRVASGQTLLDAALRAGLKPPYSCQSGVCGACRARLTKGEVHMQARMALEDTDVARGDILTCQSRAKTGNLEVSFGK